MLCNSTELTKYSLSGAQNCATVLFLEVGICSFSIYKVNATQRAKHTKSETCMFSRVCKFSDFSLISDFFTSTPLKIIFEISCLQHSSHGFRTH